MDNESSGSLTSTESMEIDTFEQATPAEPRSPISGSTSGTPTQEVEKVIVVEQPAHRVDTPSASLSLEDEEDQEVVTPQHKRKRVSVNYNLGDDMIFSKLPTEEPSLKRAKPQAKMRGVIIGVWRDSSEYDDADKHVIYGFIDIHDRLRTRIYGSNRRGEEVKGNMPTGAGGCWVTFPRIIFEQHLLGLSPAEIKEYVKLRSDTKPETTPEEREAADLIAVVKAKQIALEEGASPIVKSIVHRPLGKSTPNRTSLSRQSLHKTSSFQAINAAHIQTPKASPSNEGKSLGVLLGYWSESDELHVADKHAVFGVLSGSDCFRVKVQRVTRDGRFVDGNFPIGAGALWLHYEKVVFEPHLAPLTRPEVKEYTRIRQKDLERREPRESEKERKVNEAKAVEMAKAVVASEGLNNGIEVTRPPPAEMETRHSSRSEQKTHARQLAESEAALEKARQEKNAAVQRQHEQSRKEIAMNESLVDGIAKQELKHNMKKLNKVWIAQQNKTHSTTAGSSTSDSDEVKYHNGIKYERKQNGPFQGKLVSAAQILSIDGEDYVEYRMLTKPSF